MVRRAIVVSLLLAAGAVFLAFASKSEPVPIRRSLSELPAQIGTWMEIRSNDLSQDYLKKLAVDDYTDRVYVSPTDASVELYIGYYRSQRQGSSIHSPLNCLPGAGWNPIERDFLPVSVDLGSSPEATGTLSGEISINRIVVQKGLDRLLVLYWYQSHGRVVASEYWGKIYSVIDAMRTNRTDAALVRVSCPIAGAGSLAATAAEQNAINFVRSLFPLLGQYLPD